MDQLINLHHLRAFWRGTLICRVCSSLFGDAMNAKNQRIGLAYSASPVNISEQYRS